MFLLLFNNKHIDIKYLFMHSCIRINAFRFYCMLFPKQRSCLVTVFWEIYFPNIFFQVYCVLYSKCF